MSSHHFTALIYCSATYRYGMKPPSASPVDRPVSSRPIDRTPTAIYTIRYAARPCSQSFVIHLCPSSTGVVLQGVK